MNAIQWREECRAALDNLFIAFPPSVENKLVPDCDIDMYPTDLGSFKDIAISDWRTIAFDFVYDNLSAISAFRSDALAFILPAYLWHGLEDTEPGEYVLTETLDRLAIMKSGVVPNKWGEYVNDEQRRCICKIADYAQKKCIWRPLIPW